jgi:hypothetical protein
MKRLSNGIFLLAILVFSISSAHAQLNSAERVAYSGIAYHVLDRIVALKKQYPHLSSLQQDLRKEESADKLWIAFDYAHAMSRAPNPDHRPNTKGDAQIKVFSKTDGVELNLYFFEGSWPGQAAVPYPLFQIGEMNVVTFIEGAETPELSALRRDVRRILQEEQSIYARKMLK